MIGRLRRAGEEAAPLFVRLLLNAHVPQCAGSGGQSPTGVAADGSPVFPRWRYPLQLQGPWEGLLLEGSL